jgi:ubiquinone/menaquinone biosynthesis C-methylase UbiE
VPTEEEPRLNAGCGTDTLQGWVNVDSVQLPGVDVVHDLARVPWPFPDDHFKAIRLINILEHLPDTLAVMEEVHRVARRDCLVTIRVPCTNGPDAISDPTHRSFFNHYSFDFFDPRSTQGEKCTYYSSAKFRIGRTTYFMRLIYGLPYLRVSARPLRLLMSAVALFLGGIIWAIEVELAPA